MESPGGMADGGVGIEPWQIPKMGSVGTGSGRRWETTGTIPTQGNASTGVGGMFAQGVWPGKMPTSLHRGLYGGPGIRTGGAY